MNIEQFLNVGKSDRPAVTKISKQADRVSDRFDYVFWFGDLNYRVNIDIPIKDLEEKNYLSILLHDQLL